MSLNTANNKDSIQIKRKRNTNKDSKDKIYNRNIIECNTIEIMQHIDISSKIQYINKIIYQLINNTHISSILKDLRKYDEYTFNHSIRVAITASLLGVDIGVSKKELKNLATGALLHDIGKQFIPINILNKQGRLTEIEMDIVKQHPKLGYNLIKKSKHLNQIEKEIVYQHHENYNGMGYPRQLIGDEINDLAMIVHICDVYDALISKRSYKEPFTINQALSIINEGDSILYNPEILYAFNKHISYYTY